MVPCGDCQKKACGQGGKGDNTECDGPQRVLVKILGFHLIHFTENQQGRAGNRAGCGANTQGDEGKVQFDKASYNNVHGKYSPFLFMESFLT